MLIDCSDGILKDAYLDYTKEEEILFKRFIHSKESNMRKVKIYHMSIHETDLGYEVTLLYGTPNGAKVNTFYVSKSEEFGILQVGDKNESYAIIANVRKEGLFSIGHELELFKLYFNPNMRR